MKKHIKKEKKVIIGEGMNKNNYEIWLEKLNNSLFELKKAIFNEIITFWKNGKSIDKNIRWRY